ncbi:MAG: DUF3576 domain-containing protein, partial [Alphaproteobacteria bacterium]|nr:DUF3576 domain-containing protein [Alphaproteobacteria bacterium]
MVVRYYGLRLAFAASISFALAACGSDETVHTDPVTGIVTKDPAADAPKDPTEQTIFTVLGLGKTDSQRNVGPQTGATVSQELWEAAHDSLNFTKITSEDLLTGLIVTDWYYPPGKPNERLRVSVFILSRALRSDSLSVTVERQERSPTSPWHDTPVALDVQTGLESAILLRA